MNYFFIQTREQNNFFRIRFNDNHLQDKPVTLNLSCLGKQYHDFQLNVTNSYLFDQHRYAIELLFISIHVYIFQ